MFSTTTGRTGSSAFVVLGGKAGGAVDTGFGAGAAARCRASSKVPHIPQKRKLSELFSPHFGQITMVLRRSFLQSNLWQRGHSSGPFILECKRPVSDAESS